MHTVDLAKIKVGDSVAILGAGPIGLYVLQLVKLSGADPIFVSDKFPWRLKLAEQYGAIPINCDEVDQVQFVQQGSTSYWRIPHSHEVDRLLMQLTDLLISIRYAHPAIVQLEMSLELGEP